MNHKLLTSSIGNARHIGGYINKDGRKVKENLLLRSAPLHHLTKEDVEILKNTYNLKKVYDFRASDEREKKPDDEIEGVINLWVPILDEATRDDGFAKAAKEFNNDPVKIFMHICESEQKFTLYTDIMMSKFGQEQYSKFIKDIINTPQGSVLWHCSAGKDRTGVAALLLLYMLDVDMETILYDYNLTNAYRTKEIEVFSNLMKSHNLPEKYYPLLQAVEGVGEENLLEGIESAEKEFGSLMGYIHDALHISDEEIQILKDRYLE